MKVVTWRTMYRETRPCPMSRVAIACIEMHGDVDGYLAAGTGVSCSVNVMLRYRGTHIVGTTVLHAHWPLRECRAICSLGG
jgi:hypothetical protein